MVAQVCEVLIHGSVGGRKIYLEADVDVGKLQASRSLQVA